MLQVRDPQLSSPAWSRQEKLALKRLYLVSFLSPKEIAEKMGKTPKQVSNVINRLGWAAKRREIESKQAAEAEQKATEAAKEYAESTLIRAEELAGRGMDLAEAAADAGDAKSFALAASGFKVFDATTRKGYGLDAQQIGADSLAVIFAQRAPAELNVTPEPAKPLDKTEAEDFDGI